MIKIDAIIDDESKQKYFKATGTELPDTIRLDYEQMEDGKYRLAFVDSKIIIEDSVIRLREGFVVGNLD